MQARNNPDSENKLPHRHRPCKLGWLGEVLSSEGISNTSPHSLKTVPESHFGSLNRQTISGIIIAEEIPEFVSPCRRWCLPNGMELAHNPNHPAFDAL